MNEHRLEVADIFRTYETEFFARWGPVLGPHQRKAFEAIRDCRTAALGGHVDQCDACGHRAISYNSCRNRHCPKCQALARARWLTDSTVCAASKRVAEVWYTKALPVIRVASFLSFISRAG